MRLHYSLFIYLCDLVNGHCQAAAARYLLYILMYIDVVLLFVLFTCAASTYTCGCPPANHAQYSVKLTPLLLRVKTSDDADEVIDMIKKVREESN